MLHIVYELFVRNGSLVPPSMWKDAVIAAIWAHTKKNSKNGSNQRVLNPWPRGTLFVAEEVFLAPWGVFIGEVPKLESLQ